MNNQEYLSYLSHKINSPIAEGELFLEGSTIFEDDNYLLLKGTTSPSNEGGTSSYLSTTVPISQYY